VIRRIDRHRFEVIGLASDSENKAEVARYLESMGCSDLPVVFVGADVLKSYKLSLTPMTIVVKDNGTVDEVWRGKWSTSVISTAGQVLGVQITAS
jgi:hypothetical protein